MGKIKNTAVAEYVVGESTLLSSVSYVNMSYSVIVEPNKQLTSTARICPV